MALIETIMPNVLKRLPELYTSTVETIYMTFIAGFASLLFGLILGVILIITQKDGIAENTVVYNVIDKITNLFRSIPFIILLVALFPITRLIVGTAIGKEGMILPLIVGTTPFFTRQIESALAQLDPGLIEAAQSMGCGTGEIIFRVYLRESIPSLVRATAITFISLIGLTAMAGAVGGGGLGNFAIRYGHDRGELDIIYVSIIVLLLLVSLIQGISNLIINGIPSGIKNILRKDKGKSTQA